MYAFGMGSSNLSTLSISVPKYDSSNDVKVQCHEIIRNSFNYACIAIEKQMHNDENECAMQVGKGALNLPSFVRCIYIYRKQHHLRSNRVSLFQLEYT